VSSAAAIALFLCSAPVAADEAAIDGGAPPAMTVKRLGATGAPFSLGVVADPREALPATLDNLRQFAAVFARAKVDAVLALGGLGASEDEIARVLAALRDAHAPVLALPGAREPEAAFRAAVTRARRAGVDVVDLSAARGLDAGAFGLVALPGVNNAHYSAKNGFRYRVSDISNIQESMASLPKPRIFAASSAPRGRGPEAIDWALGGANDGEPALAKIAAELVIAAQPGESGGRAVAPHDACDGCSAPTDNVPLAEGVWSERLWLNAGAADSVPHALAQGGFTRGQAALVEFADGKFRFKVIRP
jgi:hypothetical protein